MTIIRYIIVLFISVASIMLASSCDVHEFPDPKIEFVLNLEYDAEMPLYQVIEYGETRSKSTIQEYSIRYKVNVFDADNPDSREVLYSFVFMKDNLSELNNSVTLPLPRGEYRFAVWTDYVPGGSETDFYYNTEKFEYIYHAEGPHVGSNNMRDAFSGVITSVVSKEITSADVEMRRPMGKFNFVTTDAGGYDLDGCSVIFYYNGFMPYAYNMHTSKLSDSRTGVCFTSNFLRIDENEAELGFDYVFVNGKETIINVFVEIYDPEGKMLSRSKQIDVPIVRSKLTTVRAQFLTMKAGGGVSLIPDYDGEYNLVVN